ncbi:MAG: glycosyltransferase family 4 protein [Sulfuricellaceae bacterium]|nr:glycosyltransferase family 4 protein [Sulfuricellaceae bacterium]
MTERPRVLALFGSGVVFGQERGNIEALAALKEQGCDVLCLVRDEASCVHVPPELDARGLAWLKVPYIEHRVPGRMHAIAFRNPVAFVRANWRFLQIVQEFRPTHVHAFNQLYVLNFLIGLTVLRLPMVFRAGDEPTVHNWIWRLLWKFVVWQTDRFVANSRFVARSLRNHGVAEDLITVIYNAPPQRTHVIESLSVPPEDEGMCRVTYVGQISEHKGVHVLVEAFRTVVSDYPNAQLVIAGRISEWSGDAWARRLRDATANDPLLGKHVLFVGEIADVPGLLSRSTIHVAPSLFDDPSPNVVMEAKQAARPSIVFPRGGMPELVEDGVDGFVCREATSESLAEALRCYLDNAGLARRHGQAAYASLARLGVGQFAERWLNVYTSATRQGQNKRAEYGDNRDVG